VTDKQASLVAGENILRVWSQVEAAAAIIQQTEKPSEEYWEGRIWEPEITTLPRLFDGRLG
jgi:membrane dipeptidase